MFIWPAKLEANTFLVNPAARPLPTAGRRHLAAFGKAVDVPDNRLHLPLSGRFGGEAMSKRFCTNCGTQLGEGASFCTSCGAQVAGAEPAQADIQPPSTEGAPPPVPPPQGAPPPAAAPLPATEPPPVAAPAPVAAPHPPAGPAPARPGGLPRPALIGIAVIAVLALVIAIFVQRSEREFQRQRRANQTSLGTSGSPSQPNGSAAYGGFNSGGAVGSDGWVRSQLVGSWTETRDCSNPIAFRADGTTTSGRWAFQGGRLSLIESNDTVVVELVSIGTAEMVMAHLSTGRQMTWRRC
jgi:hypothetical protein